MLRPPYFIFFKRGWGSAICVVTLLFFLVSFLLFFFCLFLLEGGNGGVLLFFALFYCFVFSFAVFFVVFMEEIGNSFFASCLSFLHKKKISVFPAFFMLNGREGGVWVKLCVNCIYKTVPCFFFVFFFILTTSLCWVYSKSGVVCTK